MARFCVKHGLHIQEAGETLKRAFEKAARDHFREHGEKMNVSRLSVCTGLQRKDIIRLQQEADTQDQAVSTQDNLLCRIATRWSEQEKYKKKELEAQGAGEPSFAQLVLEESSDLHSGTLLFRMQQLGMVKITSSGKIKLLRATLPTLPAPKTALNNLSLELRDHIASVEHNLSSTSLKNHHAYTVFDAIPESVVPVVSKFIYEQAQQVHTVVRKFLSLHDLDIAEQGSSKCRAEKRMRVSYGSYAAITQMTTEAREGDS